LARVCCYFRDLIMLKKFCLILLLGICVPYTGISQNLSTEGNDFWLGFMDNWLQDPNNPIILEIYISAVDTTSGVLDMPRLNQFTPIQFTVIPGATTKLTLPSSIAMAAGSDIVENKGIHIQTSKDVSVYAMNKRQYSADVAVILPIYSLSNEYIVMTHWETGNRNNNDNSDSEFLIIATEDDSEIQITPSFDTQGGNAANVPFTIQLKIGQSYQVQARGDLTGTKIVGVNNSGGNCNNFAVFAGNQYTKVGKCNHPDGHDHLFEQMYPIKTWGTSYTVVDFETRTGGDVIKVLASEDNTSVNLSGNEFTLDANQFRAFTLSGVNTITSDKPVAVAQYSRSQGCDNTIGDPFYIMISPNQQLLRSITFNAPTIATVQNYSLNVLTPTYDVPNVLFDGQHIEDKFDTVPGNPEMSFARVITRSGNHTIFSEEGFIAYVYGYGFNESFGYATGAGLANLSLGVEVTNQDGLAVPTDSICLFDQVVFQPLTNVKFNSYIYNFGDGNQITKEDKDSVVYQYQNPGKYVFTITGIQEDNDCNGGNIQTEVKVIKVINPGLEVRGPRSICPNTPGVNYFVEDNLYFDNEWIVDGGTVISYSNDSITVDWHGTKEDASVKLIAQNRYGCVGDTVIFPVRINIQLDPEAPFGPDSLCVADMIGKNYYTYNTQGSFYDWQVTNGEVISGQGTSEIAVNWFAEGYGQLWFHQTTQTDEICDGTSDTLQVYIQRVPNPIAVVETDKSQYAIEEDIQVNFSADTLLQYVRLLLNGQLYQDSLEIEQAYQMTLPCAGSYELSIEAYDTVGLCLTIATGATNIIVNEPKLEIIQVSHHLEEDSTLIIHWQLDEGVFFLTPKLLQLKTQAWQTLDTLTALTGSFELDGLSTTASTYDFRIIDLISCVIDYESRVHTSVLLEVDEAHMVSWTSYSGWQNGVSEYIVERNIDDRGWSEFDRMNANSFVYQNDTVGFDHCFRIKALEQEGNLAAAYSNVSCDFFVPELYAYNVITPNDDGKNEYFVIDNVELYANSRLQIFNRWGGLVYEQTGYQNSWKGTSNGQILANGIYFYVLELNEPRVEVESINGQISILR
jgi:gliding motility-associated-like protein